MACFISTVDKLLQSRGCVVVINAERQHPFWTRPDTSTNISSHGALPAKADVLVVGAGISGMTTALLLTRAGKKVVLIDMKKNIAGGDTGHTAAHVTALLDHPYSVIRKNFGDDGAAKIAQAHREAIDYIERLVGEENIACDFERVPNYLYASSAKDDKQIAEELQALQALGFEATAADAIGLPYATGAALKIMHQAQFEPVAYVQGLHKALLAQGGQVYLGVRYKSTEPTPQGTRQVQTTAGTIEVSDVVLASHTPPTKLALQTKMTPVRTYAIAVRCRNPPLPGLYYDTEEPYHYVRTHPHQGGQVLIVGGADHRVGSTEDTQGSFTAIETWAHEHFDVSHILCAWSGQVFEPADGAPFLGHIPGDPHSYVISGLSGHGMTSGTAGAVLCSGMILGQAPAWADVFTPARIKPLAQGSEFAAHNVSVSMHLVGDRVKAWLTKKPLGPQQGAVMRQDGTAAAVFNDGTTLHVLSPVCPHAGCYVKYNNAEKTFDCPCHGSRFAHDGTLLTGPAVSDLEKLNEKPAVE